MADNLLSAPLNVIKQITEQGNQSIQSLGTGVTTTLNKGLDALAKGLPSLPGMSKNSVQSLAPSNLTTALSKVEDVVLPRGVPKISEKLGLGGEKSPEEPAPAAASPATNTGTAPATPNGSMPKATVTTKTPKSSAGSTNIIRMGGI